MHGKSDAEAEAILEDAIAVEEAGAFAVTLEGVTASLAERITKRKDYLLQICSSFGDWKI